MMITLILSLFFITTSLSAETKYDVCPVETISKTNKTCDLLIQKPGVDTEWALETQHLFWYTNEVENLKQAIQYQTNDFATVLRHCRDHDPTVYKAAPNSIKILEQDFNDLYNIQKQIRSTKRRLDFCYAGNCTAYRRVELEDQLKNIQKSQAEIFFKNPILATKTIEDFFFNYPESVEQYSKNQFESTVNKVKRGIKDTFSNNAQNLNFLEKDEPLYNKYTLKHLFINASIDALNQLDPIKKEISNYEYDPDMPLLKKGNSSYTTEYLEKIPEKYPILAETILQKAEATGQKSKTLCQLDKTLSKNKKRQELYSIAADTTIMVAPLFLGPIGKAVATGSRPLFLSRIASWGFKGNLATKYNLFSRFAFEGLFLSNSNVKINQKENLCAQISSDFFLYVNAKNYERHKNCHQELSDERLANSMFWIGAIGTEAVIPLAQKFSKLIAPTVKKQVVNGTNEFNNAIRNFRSDLKTWATEIETPASGFFTVMDLSKIERVKDETLKNLPDKYWSFVGEIYRQRLNLTPDEIKGFIRTSHEMEYRTKLVFNTSAPTLRSMTMQDLITNSVVSGNPTKFNGGIGIVESRIASEILPIEKSTGITFPRVPGEKSVEIVRLTVSKENEKTNLSELLTTAAVDLVSADPAVTKVYIYTSKAHSVLYRRMLNIPKDRIKAIDDRDVYIELLRDDIQKISQSIK